MKSLKERIVNNGSALNETVLKVDSFLNHQVDAKLMYEMGTYFKEYFKNHPQLSYELIEELLKKQISIIGIDFSGIRNGNEHIPADQKCADNGAFVIENLCNLHKVLNDKKSAGFIANTYPVNFQGMSGLPCRVVAKI